MRSLEDEVAELETQIARLDNSPANIARVFTSKIAAATLSVFKGSRGSLSTSKLSPVFFIHQSCPPLIVHRLQEMAGSEVPTRNPFAELPACTAPATELNTIPNVAMDYMVQNYTRIHLPQYPCISATWLHGVVQRILHRNSADVEAAAASRIIEGSSIDHFEHFVLFIILAISSLTLTWRAELQARKASDSFFASALQHLCLMEEVGSIRSLQTSILLAHYAHMNPQTVDNWTCIANATKIALELASDARYGLDWNHSQLELRTQLFWVTYGMERSLCSILRLPLSFPEELLSAEVCVMQTATKIIVDIE